MTTTATTSLLSKVRSLLDAAEGQELSATEYLKKGDTEHAAEFRKGAENYRERAESIMAKYRIEVEDLLSGKTVAEGVLMPEPVPFDIYVTRQSPFMNHYAQLWGEVYRHVGVRSKGQWVYDTGNAEWFAAGVGFEADVQYAEMLFTTARMAFSERLEPKLDPKLSDQENVYRLRSAGIERIRIADIMWGNTDKVFLGRVGRLYKAECANRGETPALSGRGVTGAAYREAYADSFVMEMARRLRMARSGGNGLVLGNREQVLNEAFYKRFPDMRPKAEVGGGSYTYERCEKCAKAKSGICREHSNGGARMPKGRDPFSAAAVRGRAAGGAAARTVDLGRGSGGNAIGGA